jgi:hypothetical protein
MVEAVLDRFDAIGVLARLGIDWCRALLDRRVGQPIGDRESGAGST